MIAAHEGDMEYIALVLSEKTGDNWTAEEGTKFSLAASKVFRYGENATEYFTFEKYGEVITISIDTDHNEFGGYMNLQMSLRDGPVPTPLTELISNYENSEE